MHVIRFPEETVQNSSCRPLEAYIPHNAFLICNKSSDTSKPHSLKVPNPSVTRDIRQSGSSSQAASDALTNSNDLTAAMAADARWLKLKLLWQNMSREKQGRALGLLFIIAVAFIWVPSHHHFC